MSRFSNDLWEHLDHNVTLDKVIYIDEENPNGKDTGDIVLVCVTCDDVLREWEFDDEYDELEVAFVNVVGGQNYWCVNDRFGREVAAFLTEEEARQFTENVG